MTGQARERLIDALARVLVADLQRHASLDLAADDAGDPQTATAARLEDRAAVCSNSDAGTDERYSSYTKFS